MAEHANTYSVIPVPTGFPLYVRNLPLGTTGDEFQKLLAPGGPFEHAYVIKVYTPHPNRLMKRGVVRLGKNTRYQESILESIPAD
jgi:hypothetical protein